MLTPHEAVAADVVLTWIKETDEQNFPYFDTHRLINKINRLHKPNYKELLGND